jgi:hypothetical protein
MRTQKGCGSVTICRILLGGITCGLLALTAYDAPSELGRSQAETDWPALALDHIYNLEFDQARPIIEGRVREDPTDLCATSTPQSAQACPTAPIGSPTQPTHGSSACRASGLLEIAMC